MKKKKRDSMHNIYNDNHEMLCYNVIDQKEVDCEREVLAMGTQICYRALAESSSCCEGSRSQLHTKILCLPLELSRQNKVKECILRPSRIFLVN